MRSRPLAAEAACALVVLALAPMQASAQTAALTQAPLPSLPRIASVEPAPTSDVPGLAMAYEEPRTNVAEAIQASGFRTWGQYAFTTSRLGADANGAAVRASSHGASVGIDRFVDPTLLLGASFSYTQGRSEAVGVRSDTESFAGAGYLWWNPVAGLEVDGLLGVTGLSIDATRRASLAGAPVTLTGRTGGIGVAALAGAGYRFRSDGPYGAMYLKPFASLSYAGQGRDAYVESAGASGLAFAGKDFERATVNVGAAAGIDLPMADGWILRPEGSIAWSRHLINPSPAVPVTDLATGRSFVLRDPHPGMDGALVATEISLLRSEAMQGFLGYSGEFRGNATAHQFRVGLRSNW